MELILVIRGAGVLQMYGESLELEQGMIVLFNREDAHEITGGPNGIDVLGIQISPDFLYGYLRGMSALNFEKRDLKSVLDCECFKHIYESLIGMALSYFSGEKYFELKCVSCIAELLRVLYQRVPLTELTKQKSNKRIAVNTRRDRICAIIDDSYQHSLTLEAIAEREGITPAHLSHIFKESMGINFRSYLNNVRFEHAYRILHNPKKSILDIAIESGFSDQKYLAAIFKKRFNCTPSQFRSRHIYPAIHAGQLVNALQTDYSEAESIVLLEMALRSE